MNYEQKYKEALENARWKIEHVDCGDENCFNIDDIKDMFSELRESEDERIRNLLISLVENWKVYNPNLPFADYPIYESNKEICDKIIAWLEKQGENSACKIKIGETYKCIASPRYTCFRIGDIYHVTDNFVAELINICSGCFVLLEKQGEQKSVEQDTETRDLWVYIKEWREKFGRLPKDEDELAACIDYVMKRQKPAEWSEEDEKIIESLLKIVEAFAKEKNHHWFFDEANSNDINNWLKSLKDRVQPQPKQEWSEEDEARFKNLCSIIDESNWLKSLKPNHWKPSEEQMEALNAINTTGEISYIGQGNLLIELYNDLKKL